MPLAFMESTQSAALEMKKVPHVIVTPSALPPFVKTLSCGNAKVTASALSLCQDVALSKRKVHHFRSRSRDLQAAVD